MFAFCVFRRYGILAPIVVLLVGCLVELSVNKGMNQDGYYSSHPWAIGLNFVISGVLLSIFVWIIAPPHTSATSVSYAPVDLENVMPKTNNGAAERNLEWPTKDSLYEFATTPCEADQFCYLPMNFVAFGITGLGVLLVMMDIFRYIRALL